MKGLGFSQVEVCEIVRKSLFLFVKRPKRANDALNDCGKVDEMLCFLLICILRTVHLRQLKEMKSFQLGMLKGG